MATGPSLLKTDLRDISGLPVIGLNRIYLGMDQLDVRPDYLVCVNDLLLSQHADELVNLDIPIILPWSARGCVRARPGLAYVNAGDGEFFQHDLRRFVPVGSTVTFVALQLAFWLGFDEVQLVGLDHAYALEQHETALSPHDVAERTQPDVNHFHPDYFGTGAKWQLPDLRASECAYLNAKIAYEEAGKQIVNVTPGTALDVFERRPLPTL